MMVSYKNQVNLQLYLKYLLFYINVSMTGKIRFMGRKFPKAQEADSTIRDCREER